MEQQTAKNLCKRFLADTLDPKELAQLLDYLRDEEEAEVFKAELLETIGSANYPGGAADPEAELTLQRLLSLIRNPPGQTPSLAQVFRLVPDPKPTQLSRLVPRRLAAAAAVLVLLTGVYLLWSRHHLAQVSGLVPPTAALHPDIAPPAAANAILTLADGRRIALDSAANGTLALQGATQVQKLADGQLAYQADTRPAAVLYNTLTVPRGSRILTLTLADGTRVWLNAESSLRYPVAFGAGPRGVSITGEAYFEVARDPAHPFRVTAGATTTDVLGTDFNVNAYGNPAVRITLLEGKVAVRGNAAAHTLAPGEQAAIDATGVLAVRTGADLEAVMAWKNGLFHFNDEDLPAIMAQIHRWYNVDIVYEGNLRPLNFGGVISRRKNVTAVLDLLQGTGTVRFRIEPPRTSGSAGTVVVQL